MAGCGIHRPHVHPGEMAQVEPSANGLLIVRTMRLAIACLLTGCIAPASTSSSPDPDDPGSPTPTPTLPAPVASGTFQVTSTIDLTVEALLPEPAEQIVVTLREFSTNPAHTMIDLADQAGVPAVQEIRDALPSYVMDKLEGWINGEIAKLTINGVPVTQAAGSIASLAQTALTHFAIDSELAIAGGTATHTLETLDLSPAGIDVQVALDALPADVIAATATCTSQKGALALGDHAYALAYGEYMWSAVNLAVTAQYGSDLRGMLGQAVNCPALAHTIASKCYLGYCVGHETQLTSICNAGLDEVVDRMHAEFSDLRFDAIHFAAGTATIVDANHDGAGESLASGVWTAEINAGLGLRPVPATFTATR